MKHQEESNVVINIETGRKPIHWNNVVQWLNIVARKEKKNIELISYTIISDKKLHKINLKNLKHDTYTDIITFDLSDNSKHVVGDIYLSIDRIMANALTFHVKQSEEYRRVIIHGLLHLIGYNDKTKEEKKAMRSKEDQYLELFKTLAKTNGLKRI